MWATNITPARPKTRSSLLLTLSRENCIRQQYQAVQVRRRTIGFQPVGPMTPRPFTETVEPGHAPHDMVSMLEAIEAGTNSARASDHAGGEGPNRLSKPECAFGNFRATSAFQRATAPESTVACQH